MKMNCELQEFLRILYSILAFMTVHSKGQQGNYFDGSVVILNTKLLEWSEAVMECEERNGTLLTVVDISTMYDIGFDGRWIVWVGLKVDDSFPDMVWNSGLPVTWTNWDVIPHPTASSGHCVSLTTSVPFGWKAIDCSVKLPSLCEVKTGRPCHFSVSKRSSLIGFTNLHKINVNMTSCRDVCINATSFHCRSFEYNEKRSICQLSEKNRWMHRRQFTTNDPEWDYYHLDCYANEVNHSVILPTVSTLAPTTTAIEATTEKFCFSLQELTPSENATKEMEMVIQELQELQTRYKNRRLAMKKESVPDHRPSATYMGGAAIVIVIALLSVIVLFDLLTFAKHFCHKVKKKKRKKLDDLANELAKKAGQSIMAERKLALSIQHLVDINKSIAVGDSLSRDYKNGGESLNSSSRYDHECPNELANHTSEKSSDKYVGEHFAYGDDSSQTNKVGDDTDFVKIKTAKHRYSTNDGIACISFKFDNIADQFPSRTYHSVNGDILPTSVVDSNGYPSIHSRRNGSVDNHTPTWHHTAMAGSTYRMAPFMGKCRSRLHHYVDPIPSNYMMETSLNKFDDG